jgi:hypothetical protein
MLNAKCLLEFLKLFKRRMCAGGSSRRAQLHESKYVCRDAPPIFCSMFCLVDVCFVDGNLLIYVALTTCVCVCMWSSLFRQLHHKHITILHIYTLSFCGIRKASIGIIKYRENLYSSPSITRMIK